MKRRMAVFMILLTNIALLAHMAVPHHHHQLRVAVTCLHGAHVGHHAHESGQEKHHHHDCTEDAEPCHIQEAVFISPRIQHDYNEGGDGLHHDVPFLPILTLCIETPFLYDSPLKHGIYAERRHQAPLTHCIGLRAPPYGLFS